MWPWGKEREKNTYAEALITDVKLTKEKKDETTRTLSNKLEIIQNYSKELDQAMKEQAKCQREMNDALQAAFAVLEKKGSINDAQKQAADLKYHEKKKALDGSNERVDSARKEYQNAVESYMWTHVRLH